MNSQAEAIAERTEPETARPAPALAEPAGGRHAWYVLFVMILAYTFSFVDRQILTLMVGPIRKSLNITDFQVSLLHGFAFALFYTVMGIPIGRMIDRRKRTVIIALGITFWSIMTAMCGLARSFGQLFLARIGVGVGEAALSPGAFSLLSDAFPPRQLGRAISIYTGAAHIGGGLATMAGGALIALVPALTIPLVGALEPWQSVFICVGLPGLLVALLVLNLREPPRSGVHARYTTRQPSLREVFAYMAERKGAYGLVILGYSVSSLVWNGGMAWLPTFFMRTWGWSIGQVAMWYGAIIMIAGTGGVVVGGIVAAWIREKGREDANVLIGLISLAVAMPAGILATVTGNEALSVAMVALFLFGCSFPYGCAAAALQEITPNQMRGQASAIYLFSLNLFGIGLGPAVVAWFTDHVYHADSALRWSLASTMVVATPVSALLLVLALRPYRQALARNDF